MLRMMPRSVVAEDHAAELALFGSAVEDVLSGLRVAALHDLHRERGLVHDAVNFVQRNGGRAAIDVGNNVGLRLDDVVRGNGGGAGDGSTAGVHLHLEAVLVGPLDHGSRSLGVVDGAEADLTDDPDAFLGEVFEVLLDQTLLEDQSAAFDLHAGNALGKALVADNGLRLGRPSDGRGYGIRRQRS